jgi:leucyl/phenylalanyl-tRNA--protein transferase
MSKISTEDLLNGYINGIFPMADEDGMIYWYAPDPRAIIPIDTYKCSKSLRPILNKGYFQIKINQNFEQVMRGCASPRFVGDSTWISDEIIQMYTSLHTEGFAHSVEAYLDEKLVGGLYGVSIGGVFFGESMFSLVSNASKVAFHYLMQILKANQFELLDTQFINDNVKRYGAIEIPRDEYMERLDRGIRQRRFFNDASLGTLNPFEIIKDV